MAQMFCGISQDLTSPNGAYERAHSLARKAVGLERVKSGYVGVAIESLSAKGNFGSWLRDLFHRKKVTIHLHYYERLLVIVADLVEKDRKRNEHIEEILRLAKGRRDEIDTVVSSFGCREDQIDA